MFRRVLWIIAAISLVLSGPLALAQIDVDGVLPNVAPTVTDVSVAATVLPTAGSTTAVPVTVTVTDTNGFQDLATVTVTVFKPDGTTVHVAAATATSNNDGSGATVTYGYSFNMAYTDVPAAAEAGYVVSAVAADALGLSSSTSTTTFAYSSLVAVTLSSSTFSFGSLTHGARTAANAVTVTNAGNVVVDITAAGTALSDGAGHSMAASRIRYDLDDNVFDNEQTLGTSAATHSSFDLAVGGTQATYWALDVPTASVAFLPQGTYSGTITIGAVSG